MKQIKFLAAALAALTMLSCSKDGSKGPDDGSSSTGKTVTINFANLAQSGRAIGSPMPKVSNATLSDAGIYFVTASNTVLLSKEITNPNDFKAAITCAGVPNNATKVYIVTNYKKSVGAIAAYPIVTDQSGRGPLDDLKKKFTGITAESQATVADIMMDGEAAITPQTAEGVTTYVANVTISPLVARIELAQFTLQNTGGGTINSYDLQGVFVNNVYQNLDLSSPVGNNILLSRDQAPFEANGNHPTWFKDWDAAGFNRTGLVTEPSATNTEVWGYNIFPAVKSAGTDNRLPQIILRFNNVQINADAPITTAKYFTVMKFKNIATVNGGSDIESFERNKCYIITNISAEHGSSPTDPEVENIDVTVTVKVSDWTIVEIEPA